MEKIQSVCKCKIHPVTALEFIHLAIFEALKATTGLAPHSSAAPGLGLLLCTDLDYLDEHRNRACSPLKHSITEYMWNNGSN